MDVNFISVDYALVSYALLKWANGMACYNYEFLFYDQLLLLFEMITRRMKATLCLQRWDSSV